MGRLSSTTSSFAGSTGGSRPGDVITIPVKDSKGKEIADPIVFTRTDRDFAYDLCDAYNARRRHPDSPFWFVDHAGNIKPGEPPRAPTEVWKPDPIEVEATRAVVAKAMRMGMNDEEWRRLVRNGGVTREVEKTMREMVQDQAA